MNRAKLLHLYILTSIRHTSLASDLCRSGFCTAYHAPLLPVLDTHIEGGLQALTCTHVMHTSVLQS
jgi:hypothetical protein